MATIHTQSQEVDVCIVALSDYVLIADVSRSEAEAIVAAYERVIRAAEAHPRAPSSSRRSG
jgi:hypothetical protein